MQVPLSLDVAPLSFDTDGLPLWFRGTEKPGCATRRKPGFKEREVAHPQNWIWRLLVVSKKNGEPTLTARPWCGYHQPYALTFSF